MGKTISLYLNEETLNKLDELVAANADKDRLSSLTGHQVTSRSTLVAKIIDEYACNYPTELFSIENIQYAIVPIAKEFGVERIALFGSRARGDENPDSDIDLVIDKGKVRGLISSGSASVFNRLSTCT